MFVITPRPAPAPAYQACGHNPFGFCSPVYNYRVSHPLPQPRRPQHASFNSLFNQVDELLREIDREAQRQAQLEAHLEAQREIHRQRQQQRKRALRARFAVNQNAQGWQVDGDFQGFTQENINIEVTDEYTLKVTGNTEQRSESTHPEAHNIDPVAIAAPEEPHQDLGSGEVVEPPSMEASPQESDTESHKSYQPTVEDDYEDLGAETSSLISESSRPSASATPAEPKGKEKAVEQPIATETAVVQQPQLEAPAQEQQGQEEKRVHGTFQRTFRFPERIDVYNVSASFKEGALKINVPREEAPRRRRIAIL